MASSAMKLVVAEKPSVARDLAKVLAATKRGKGWLEGNGWTVTWCIGHLVELEEPHAYDAAWKRWSFATLPMLPAAFRLRPAKRTLEQWRIVRDLMRQTRFESVVNACDAGREGELIFRYVHERAKSRLPIERLWISSLTTDAIRAGFARLRPGAAYDGLAAAARCRSQADWLVGLNATRAMTLVSPAGSVYSVGRVQTPTLAILVDREQAIRGFEPQPFWEVIAQVRAPAGDDDGDGRQPEEQMTFAVKWRAAQGATRLAQESLADELVARVGTAGALEVAYVGRRETRERPPQLFDLTSLQREANGRLGFTADRTLKGLQSLYERHKAISYPRTSSRYLSSDQRSTLEGLVGKLADHPACGAHAAALRGKLRITSRIINDAKVTDHHAIIPTGRLPKVTGDESKLFELVLRRFLASLADDARFQSTEIVLSSAAGDRLQKPLPRARDAIVDVLPPPPDRFVARGRVVLDAGWQRVEPPRHRTEQQLPDVALGMRLTAQVRSTKGTTKPPPRYTDASLLGIMETAGKLVDDEALREAMKDCGLGTPATRASIIETLIRRDYVARQKKLLVPTDKGIELIAKLPVVTLRSAELTGDWEARLQRIADGKLTAESFMADVCALVTDSVTTIRAARRAPEQTAKPLKPIGRCPRCGSAVREERSNFACVACRFQIPRRLAGRAIEATEAALLLERGRTGTLSGFRSKKKRRFRAALTLEDGEVTFSFPGKRNTTAEPPKARPPKRADAFLAELTCPGCQRTGLVSGRRAWGCAAWRGGCKFVVPYVIDGKKLTDNELRDLITKGRTRKARFASGKGRLHLEGARVELRMAER